jgi:hypothetical protein
MNEDCAAANVTSYLLLVNGGVEAQAGELQKLTTNGGT